MEVGGGYSKNYSRSVHIHVQSTRGSHFQGSGKEGRRGGGGGEKLGKIYSNQMFTYI